MSPLTHARTLQHPPPLPQNAPWAPYTPPQAPRAQPAAGHARSRLASPPRRGPARPPSPTKRCESFAWVLRKRQNAVRVYSDLKRGAWGGRKVAVDEVTRDRGTKPTVYNVDGGWAWELVLAIPSNLPWAGENGWGKCSAPRCSSHAPGNLMRPPRPRPAAGARPRGAICPPRPPNKACGEKGSAGGTQSSQEWSLGERELGIFFKRPVLTKFRCSAEILTPFPEILWIRADG